MDSKVFTIPDSTDWLGTALADFAPFESALRCQVCKDFFDTPMMTSCSHTFCSLCIRRCFAADGRCPTCRATDQDSKLRRNWTAQELVDAFQRARPGALELARTGGAAAADDSENSREGRKTRARGANNKRKLAKIQDSEDEEAEGEEDAARRPARKTRTQPRRSATSSQTPEIIVLENDDDGEFVPEDNEEEAQPNDSLVACPMCNKRMKEEAVFTHLDRCEGPDKEGTSSRQTRTRQSKAPASPHPLQQRSTRHGLASSRNPEPLQRLPQLNYSLLKDTALRKKLSELGIPASGTRAQQIRRHTEWANLWNANVDSLRPRTKNQLLSELDRWERSQSLESSGGGGIIGGASGAQVMKKNFDGEGWAKSNKGHFDELIAAARGKRAAVRKPEEKSDKEEQAGSSSITNGTTAMPPPSPPTVSSGKPGEEGGKGARPYEDNEAALEKVRDKVNNSNGDRPSLPHRDSNTMDEANHSTTPADHTPALTVSSPSSSQAKASPSKPAAAPADREKLPSSLPAHLATSKDVRTKTMFEIPSEPVIDVDTETSK
ncbi:postreplication repair e3 ubiquitin-protein ligase rad18 [Diplodia corticola]|uniref:Postreplication repair E3 ubiquitin-protein ligase RAD18 n=1 Tax=Diplodia corticola TaxID=236234 RepID=A0A1J9S7X3_9PEZI|nr:postreplication repair e3 ubiquitin-protein ligase rad18 [Diplodia corticola]OJD35677.1 postreplication repair e3 ubiquitin-protein ligase rad18 [Diplodia corticola]